MVWGMPRRNLNQLATEMTLAHVYNRERSRGPMFIDDEDRRFFLSSLKRHLSVQEFCDSRGRRYRNLRADVRLASFCLMTNHFHLVLFQIRAGGISALMRSVMNAYVQYFNARHGTGGNMLDASYRRRAALKPRDKRTAIAYAHDNHGADCMCEFCSHRYFIGDAADVPSWTDVRAGLDLFGGVDDYKQFRQARLDLRSVESANAIPMG